MNKPKIKNAIIVEFYSDYQDLFLMDSSPVDIEYHINYGPQKDDHGRSSVTIETEYPMLGVGYLVDYKEKTVYALYIGKESIYTPMIPIESFPRSSFDVNINGISYTSHNNLYKTMHEANPQLWGYLEVANV